MAIDFQEDKIDFQPEGNTATLDFQPEESVQIDFKPALNLKQLALQPISKTITGKSLTERAGFVAKNQKEMEKLGTKRASEGKPISTAEFFMRQLPSQVAETATNLVDLSPADVGVMAATAGVAKIPIKGIPLGEIVSKIPVNKRFFKSINELGRYQETLKAMTPLSSRGIPKTQVAPIKTPDFAENINLTKYPQDVRQTISDLVTDKPELGKTPTIPDEKLLSMASGMKDTPTIKYLSTLPEGTIEAEALKNRMGNVDNIRQALAGELGNLKNQLDDNIAEGLSLHRKTASMFGRGLRQQRLPAETQQKMAFAIEDSLKRISKDPIFSKDKELIDTIKKLKGLVVSKEFNPTIWNKTYYVWLNSILSNPWTHLVNTASNTFFTISKVPEKLASAVWDLPISKITGKRTQFFGEVPAMLGGLLKKTPELATGSKIDMMTAPLRGNMGKIIGAPTTLLQVEDNLAKSVIGRMEYWGQKYAGKTGEELLGAVNKEQLYRTFQNDAGMIADVLMSMRSKIPTLRYIIPFIKTPANLIARGLERTPLVAAKIIHKARLGTYTQEELTKDLGNLTLGTLGSIWVGLQWAKGKITGRAPIDSAQRDAFYRQGKKPNAIRVGDSWIPLDRLEPLGSSFSTMANLIQDYATSKQPNIPEKSLEAVSKLGSTLINKTYLSGFTNMVKALSDPEMYGKGFFQRIASGATPQLLKFFADLKDPYYREANTVLEQMKMKIPGLSETLPPKLNVFGEPVKRDFMNIGKANESKLEKAVEETPIGFPSKSLGKEKLSPEEYQYLVKTSGGMIKRILERVNYDTFMGYPLEVREKVINAIQSNSRQVPSGLLRLQREKNKKIDFQPQ